eukprot:NODE_10943_length_482_cov_37.693593_g10289_i0.p1 GENE.NODE_10943_length_482_cov_37.693593_g10289_i0~~NODE_10943_length_482_cov_37.693593_g10289_i0.p1  ORF type:complete len:156 (-),score=37.42 NODE_10943_length_482_cov_37.693593_g10289_i0:13-480(-)
MVIYPMYSAVSTQSTWGRLPYCPMCRTSFEDVEELEYVFPLNTIPSPSHRPFTQLVLTDTQTKPPPLDKNAVSECDSESSCVVCMAAPRTVMFLPCRHSVCCTSCARQLPRCPVCNASFDDVDTGMFNRSYLPKNDNDNDDDDDDDDDDDSVCSP